MKQGLRIDLSWTDFKLFTVNKKLPYHYVIRDNYYLIWAQEGLIIYVTAIIIQSGDSDFEEFEDNYKSKANLPIYPISDDGKEIVKSEVRPLNCTTMLTSAGDSDTVIGSGKWLVFDFANDDDLIDMPSGSGLKRKRLEFSFLDSIWLKEGIIYQFNAPKGAYADLYVVCPSGQYYINNDGISKLANEDISIAHFVCKHPLIGNCPMGDELNSESVSEEIPNTYKFWIDITAPDDNSDFYGHFSLEIFRKRTIIL